MASTTPITHAKLSSADHYRLQVDADKRIVAYMYGYLADRGFGPKTRGEAARAAERAVVYEFVLTVVGGRMTDDYERWLREKVADPELLEAARNFLAKFGIRYE